MVPIKTQQNRTATIELNEAGKRCGTIFIITYVYIYIYERTIIIVIILIMMMMIIIRSTYHMNDDWWSYFEHTHTHACMYVFRWSRGEHIFLFRLY